MEKKCKIPKVAFIDDGINPKHIPEGLSVAHFVADEGEVQADTPISGDSHGSTCYQIFRTHVQTQYHLVSIKVLNSDTGTGTAKNLLAALHWCVDQDIDLINMSMGTRQYVDFAPISEVVNLLSKTVIVAAGSNQNELTFPACHGSVIGVRHCNHEDLRNKFVYFSVSHDRIDVMTDARDLSISHKDDQTIILESANSFATPIITARVCDYLTQGHIGLDAIRQRLKADATDNISFTDYEFYKSLLFGWEDLCIPVVALLDETPVATDKLNTLLGVFVQDGYRAVGLSRYCASSAYDLIFHLNRHGEDRVSLPALIELYYNFTLPDILFLHIGLQDLFSLPSGLQADIIIMSRDAKVADYDYRDKVSILELDESAEHLFLKIKGLLS